MTLERVVYRVRQLASAFAVRTCPEERVEIDSFLSPAERDLFYNMGGPALRHCLLVFRHLRSHSVDDRELLAAALLHDVGKRNVTVAHRVASVLLDAFSPGTVDKLGSPGGPRWRRGFHAHHHHPELGAELAERAGSSRRVVELIRYHHSPDRAEPVGLVALRLADEGH